jgi:hypothetical protein
MGPKIRIFVTSAQISTESQPFCEICTISHFRQPAAARGSARQREAARGKREASARQREAARGDPKNLSKFSTCAIFTKTLKKHSKRSKNIQNTLKRHKNVQNAQKNIQNALKMPSQHSKGAKRSS